jgi:hypothetical protein
MCNFLRRPGDYGGTSPNGYIGNVVIDSSVPNVAVSYSAQPNKNKSALDDLRIFINTHPNEIRALEKSSPKLHTLLLRATYGKPDGL